jgi:hypothetical protein
MCSEEPDWLATTSDDIQVLYRYWKTKAGTRRMPARRDIDPLDVVALLPSILLVDVLAQPGDGASPAHGHYVYRLVGTREVEMRGADPTGKPIATHGLGGMTDLALCNYDKVVRSKRPFLDRNEDGLQVHHRFQDLDCAFFPLSSDGEQVDMVLVYTVQREIPLSELVSLASPQL